MKKFSKKTFGLVATIECLGMILMELLIIFKVLPYDIVMGGKLESYKQAVSMITVNIFILVLLVFCILIDTELIKKVKLMKICNIVIIFFTVYFSFNFILNCLGKTWFEKIGANLLTVILIICLVNIIKRRKQSDVQ